MFKQLSQEDTEVVTPKSAPQQQDIDAAKLQRRGHQAPCISVTSTSDLLRWLSHPNSTVTPGNLAVTTPLRPVLQNSLLSQRNWIVRNCGRCNSSGCLTDVKGYSINHLEQRQEASRRKSITQLLCCCNSTHFNCVRLRRKLESATQ